MSAIYPAAVAGPTDLLAAPLPTYSYAVSRLVRAAQQAVDHNTPVCVLTSDEKLGLAIAAGVPVDFVDGKLVTAQPVGISRIAGEYHVYTCAE